MFNSILARVFGITFGCLMLALAAMIAIMQTPLSGRIFDGAIMESADGITELVWLIETSPPEVRDAILSTYASRSRVAWIREGFAPELAPDSERAALLTEADNAVASLLKGRDIRFDLIGALELARRSGANPDLFYNSSSALHIAIALKDGGVLNIWLAPSIIYREAPIAPYFLFAVVLVVTALLGFALHWVIMRPIRALEHDAELVGLAETAVPVSETGPRELRRLSQALNRMRLRLDGLIREREQIMIAIAHDIRTGITKLRLRMDRGGRDGSEKVPVNEIEPDLNQIERLLSDMMAYARAENPVAEHELIELRSFTTKFAEAAPYEAAVLQDGPVTEFTVAGSKVALTRMLENILENARRYGGGEITLRLSDTAEGFVIAVEDNGPGLSPDDLERAFEPFFRGEKSRSRNTGGTGLGLGIARAIAHTHGARINLTNLKAGGLCVQIVFPRSLRA